MCRCAMHNGCVCFQTMILSPLTMLQDFIYILLREFNETILDGWSQSSPATEPPHGMQWCVSMLIHGLLMSHMLHGMNLCVCMST